MSIYNNTIKSMIEYRTLSGHLSALGKIMASTEDGHLYRLIQDAGSSLQYQLQHRIGRQIPISLMAGPGPQIVQLYEYCMQQKQSKKAEWQVLAERHGWRPSEQRRPDALSAFTQHSRFK